MVVGRLLGTYLARRGILMDGISIETIGFAAVLDLVARVDPDVEIGEQERDRPGRQLSHRRSWPSEPQPSRVAGGRSAAHQFSTERAWSVTSTPDAPSPLHGPRPHSPPCKSSIGLGETHRPASGVGGVVSGASVYSTRSLWCERSSLDVWSCSRRDAAPLRL